MWGGGGGSDGPALQLGIYAADGEYRLMAGDTLGNAPLVSALHGYLAGRGYTGLRMTLRSYALGHLAMDGPAFQDALPFIFDSP